MTREAKHHQTSTHGTSLSTYLLYPSFRCPPIHAVHLSCHPLFTYLGVEKADMIWCPRSFLKHDYYYDSIRENMVRVAQNARKYGCVYGLK